MIVIVTSEPDSTEFILDDPQAARRAAVLSVTGLAVSILIAVLTIVPAAFAIGGPGPTFDTLGEKDGKPLVEISGAPTYPIVSPARTYCVRGR